MATYISESNLAKEANLAGPCLHRERPSRKNSKQRRSNKHQHLRPAHPNAKSVEENITIGRCSSPSLEYCEDCNRQRHECECNNWEYVTGKVSQYTLWKLDLNRSFHEQQVFENIPEAISGNFTPAYRQCQLPNQAYATHMECQHCMLPCCGQPIPRPSYKTVQQQHPYAQYPYVVAHFVGWQLDHQNVYQPVFRYETTQMAPMQLIYHQSMYYSVQHHQYYSYQ